MISKITVIANINSRGKMLTSRLLLKILKTGLVFGTVTSRADNNDMRSTVARAPRVTIGATVETVVVVVVVVTVATVVVTVVVTVEIMCNSSNRIVFINFYDISIRWNSESEIEADHHVLGEFHGSKQSEIQGMALL
jgi:hypothetical protein